MSFWQLSRNYRRFSLLLNHFQKIFTDFAQNLTIVVTFSTIFHGCLTALIISFFTIMKSFYHFYNVWAFFTTWNFQVQKIIQSNEISQRKNVTQKTELFQKLFNLSEGGRTYLFFWVLQNKYGWKFFGVDTFFFKLLTLLEPDLFRIKWLYNLKIDIPMSYVLGFVNYLFS